MYVIFPADEVVYLSYGRLIYVPPAQSQQQLEQLPDSEPLPCSGHTTGSFTCPSPSIPSTSSSNRSARSSASVPIANGFSDNNSENSSQGNKKKYTKNNVESVPVRPERRKEKLQNNKSESNFLKFTKKNSKEKLESTTDNFLQVPPTPTPRGKTDKRLSYSDFLPVHKSLKEAPPVSPGKKSPKYNKSPNFDDLFKRELTPTKSILRSTSQTDPASESRLQLSRLQLSPEKSPIKKKAFFKPSPKPEPRIKRTTEFGFTTMATSETSALKDLTHPTYNELLKGHNGVTFKLIRTVSDFTQQLSQMYEQHADEVQHLVANFRKRNSELRKERPACPSSIFHTWETLLQEVEIDSQALGDIASILGRQVSRPLLEKSFYRKIQSRKVFTHRESYETIIAKTEEKLTKCRQEYKSAYLLYLATPTSDTLSAYFNTHNAYVQQLHATNGMLDEYTKETLPQLLQELEEIYADLCCTLSESVVQGAEVVSARAMEQHRRYEALVQQTKMLSSSQDLGHFARALPVPQGRPPIIRRIFVPPQPPPPQETDGEDGPSLQNEHIPPPLKDELVIDRLSALQVKPSHDALKKEATDLEAQIRQIQDALDTLVRLQQRSVEASLFNKANEIQEDISMKRFDLRVAQIHLRAINAQKELFSNKLDATDSGRERKMSNASQGSMKTKWLKAFKSLKTPPPETEKKNGSAATKELLKGDPDAHSFQEYTYKKITPCDVCSQVLRGHTRQGLKCRICKMNIHVDCQEKASKCQAKARLLRRQKSTSEIETRVPETTVEEENYDEYYSGLPAMNRQLSLQMGNRSPQSPSGFTIESPEVDLIYQVLKQAGEISNNKPRVEPPVVGITVDRGPTPTGSGQNLNRRVGPPVQPPRTQGSSLCVINPAPCSTSSDRRAAQGTSSSESSMRRRIFAGMKSLTGFGSRSRQGSPGHRSISLPETPHSPRRQKLNLRMKSLSLDSPESTEHVQRRKHHGVATTSDPHSNQSSSSRIQFTVPVRPIHNNLVARSTLKANSTPSSPVHNRRLLSAKNIRMSSVELPDDNEKSPSSASTSPCPSPVGGKKSHRLLPTNLYVVLYNFKSRHQDELDLKAGYKVTVIDTSDPDWWKGKCLGKVGYFPSKYCSKLSPGEKPLQVTHNLQVSDGDNGLMLLRDQIVIQIGEELDGMVMIRSGDNRQGVCPVKFLQEV